MLRLPDEQVTLVTPVPARLSLDRQDRDISRVLGSVAVRCALMCFWIVTLFSQAPRWFIPTPLGPA